MNTNFDRVIWIVMDGVGAGELPDAARYGDRGSDTLGNLSQAFSRAEGRPLNLPNLELLGLGRLTPMKGVRTDRHPSLGTLAYGRAREKSPGKDTTSGHWEMAGLYVHKAFNTFPGGFPQTVVEKWIAERQLPGVIGNIAASGTDIIEKFGREHMASGKPILYTSADSVWQVAAHEETFGLERLWNICKVARKLCDDLGIARVIARPFVGDPSQGKPFSRTYHRKDLSVPPPEETILDRLKSLHIPTIGVGKIASIFAGRGIDENTDTAGNRDGCEAILKLMNKHHRGLIYVNLIDFDMLYGHRRDVRGFGRAMEELDGYVPKILEKLGPRDLCIFTADHGNDPTYTGTDHTREFVPVLAWTPYSTDGSGLRALGDLESFADMGVSVLDALTGSAQWKIGQSFLGTITQGLHP